MTAHQQPAPKEVQDEELDKISDWKLLAVRWLTRQNISTVLLMFFVGLASTGCWYAGKHVLTVIIPNHIDRLGEQITKAVELNEKSHREERKEAEARYADSVEKVTARFIEQQTKDRDLMREMLFNAGKKFTLRPPESEDRDSPN